MYRYVNGLEKKANAARIKRRKRKDKEDEQKIMIIKYTGRFDISRRRVRFYGNEDAKSRTQKKTGETGTAKEGKGSKEVACALCSQKKDNGVCQTNRQTTESQRTKTTS